MRTLSVQERLVEAGALFLIVFTPFAFGTVEPWSEAIAELVILGMVVTWLIGTVRNWELRIELPSGWLPAALFLGLLALQATLSGWSLDPGATRRLGLKLGAVAAFFLVCANTYRSRAQFRRAAWTMVATGVLISVFGVVQRVTWNGRFFWIGPEAPATAVYTFGPFANRAHFAGLVVSVLPVALVLLLTRGAKAVARRDGLRGCAARFRRWNSQTSSAHGLIPLLVVIMAGAALASGSRGAIVTLVAVLLAIVGLGGGGQSGRARWIKIAVSALLIILAGAWIGGDVLYGTIERLLTELERPDEGFRLRVWPDALTLWREAPILGSGLGSFAVAFPRFRTLRAPAVMSHAESDWLQILVETGVIGFALVVATAVALAVTLLRRRRRSRTYSARIQALAGLVALIGAAVQSLPNYNAPVMSNLIYLALALTLASIGPTAAGGVITGRAEP